jgi:hypothetical protein
MPRKLPRLVPWHSPAEFIQVYEWFYPPPAEDGSADIRAQECALRRVRANKTPLLDRFLEEALVVYYSGSDCPKAINIGEGR